MFFFFIFGESNFRRSIDGYNDMRVQCHNCGNWNAHVFKTNPFITLCWIPVIPLSIRGYQDIHCDTCQWDQALEQRPDVQAMRYGGQGPLGQGQGQHPLPSVPAPMPMNPGWKTQGPPPQGRYA